MKTRLKLTSTSYELRMNRAQRGGRANRNLLSTRDVPLPMCHQSTSSSRGRPLNLISGSCHRSCEVDGMGPRSTCNGSGGAVSPTGPWWRRRRRAVGRAWRRGRRGRRVWWVRVARRHGRFEPIHGDVFPRTLCHPDCVVAYDFGQQGLPTMWKGRLWGVLSIGARRGRIRCTACGC